jgi:hypothetical protein
LALATDSDTGISNSDRLTNDSTPTFTGTAEAGATVELISGEDSLGTVTADALGDWSVTAATLVEGEHGISAQATDVAGNVSDLSDAVTITVDTTAPSLLEVPFIGWLPDGALEDFGIMAAGVIVALPVDDYSSVQVISSVDGQFEAAGPIAFDRNVPLDGVSFWHVDADFTEGVHSLSVTAGDAAGNMSDISPAVYALVDTIAPEAPVLALAATSDSGFSATDNITSDTTPTFTGTAEADAVVALWTDNTYYGGTTADEDGVWSFTANFSLSEGDHSIRAYANDRVNNSEESELADRKSVV